MERIATVPYAPGQAYDFYEDRLVVNGSEILFEDIDGYSYSLTHSSQSVYLVPVANSASFSINIDVGNKKPFSFGRRASAPMLFKTEKHRTVDIIFAEVVKCLDVLVAPFVLRKLGRELDETSAIHIGNLTISTDGLQTKGFRKVKRLPSGSIGSCKMAQGFVRVSDKNGKQFFSCSMNVINAPLLPDILDALFGIKQ